MTLIVSLIPKEHNDDISLLQNEIGSEYNDLFGYEIMRKVLWGHEIVKLLDCELIYSLKEEDVMVYDADVIRLKNEFLILLDSADLINRETRVNHSELNFWVQNALATIRVAENNLDKVGVALW